MASRNSLDMYMDKAVGHYSSLFTLPSRRKVISMLFVACVFGGALAVFPLKPSFQGLTLGLIFGLAFFFVTVLADLMICNCCMKTDPIFSLRRCSALSFFSCLVWFFFVFLGGVISVFLRSPNVWLKLFLLGFSSALILRLLVFSAASLSDQGRIIVSSLLQPSLCSALLFFMEPIVGYSLSARLLLPFFLLSIPVAMLAVFLFISLVNRVGEKNLGIDSITLFKAFLANWTENLNAPLESIFEKFGQEKSIKISMLAFRAKESIKALVVVPALHPGPFKNVGSSPLPYIIQSTLENKLGCVVCVPHGVSGHELDLTSQLQNQRVVESILNSLDFSTFSSGASPILRTQRKGTNASCQVFGKCAFITLTTAPQTMEDLPQELDFIIAGEAEKRGLSPTIVIDAHNSIEGPFDLGVVSPLKEAAVSCIKKVSLQQKSTFEIGVAKVVPEEFDVKDGMGSGGIGVLIVKVGDQKTAYITIDGNNMVSGLREKILLALKEIDIADGEVLTTDTHAVNGIVLTERGYHPIGEAIDQAKLIDYVRQAAVTALDNLEPAEASWRMTTIPGVKIIGEKQVGALCFITEETAKLSRRLAVSLFSLAGVLLITLLILL